MNLFADLFGRNRVLFALIAVVLSAMAGYGITFLGIDDVPRKLFAADDEDFRRLEQLFEDFGSDDNDLVVVLEADDLFSRESVRIIRDLNARLRDPKLKEKGVESVQSIADVTVFPPRSLPRALLPVPTAPDTVFAELRQLALEHPLVAGQLLSRDGRMMLLFVRIRGDYIAIEQVEPVVRAVQQLVGEVTTGTSIKGTVTGIPALRTEVIHSLRQIQLNYTVLGTAIAFIAGIIVFRRPTAVMIVSLPAFMAVFWTLGLLGLMGEKLNVINSVMPSMILIIAFTDSVHMLVHIRSARADGMGRLEACQSAIRNLGLACLMTSFTTAVGFGSLMVARVKTIQNLGLDCAIGAMIGFAATMILVPLLASTRLGDNLVLKGGKETVPRSVRWLTDLLVAVVRWPRTVAVLSTAFTLYLVVTALQLESDNRLTETLPTENESYKTMERCDEAFGGVLLMHVVVEYPEQLLASSPELLACLNDIHKLFENGESEKTVGQGLLVSPLSVLNLLRSLPGGNRDLERTAQVFFVAQETPLTSLFVPPSLTARFIRADLHKAIVSVHVRDIGFQEYQPIFEKVAKSLSELEAKYPGFRLGLTGTTVVASLKVRQMIDDLASSLMLASVIIFVTMALAFRSALLGFISVLPNVFPLAFTASYLVWTGQPLQMASVIVFNIGIGMAVDNTIHLITRFQREFAIDHDVPAALNRTGHAIGYAILSTTVVLLAGFGSLSVSSIPVTRLFSVLACLTLATALVGDLVILPAMIGVFVRSGRRSAVSKPKPGDATSPDAEWLETNPEETADADRETPVRDT